MNDEHQPFLFDELQAKAAKEQAIEQVEANADPDWLQAARDAVWAILNEQPHGFTTDDVWRRLDAWQIPPPHERRALGPVMRQAQIEGWIIGTGRHQPSARVVCHQNPKTVWRKRWIDGELNAHS